eukprot:TRINITY_DN19427_c0_g1_i1.p1 TRINITY_DN19427_c0_g1~~TRINITY_DN19427_c0_g1_i1.p1  ORF type:complete len:256 (-),score=29.91 TRINITY_DN19427_c0_g1_i1:82-849(-)
MKVVARVTVVLLLLLALIVVGCVGVEWRMFKIPDLPYSYDALEPMIDKETMTIHHTKHHQAYATKVNEVLSELNLTTTETTDEIHSQYLLENWEAIIPNLNLEGNKQTKLKNNLGGYDNHCRFWKMLRTSTPNNRPQPGTELSDLITSRFGSFEAFQTQFKDAALNVFGSGWTWLVSNSTRHLNIISTYNQVSPLVHRSYPLLGIDLWEHAYYLQYQNRRAEYIDSFWAVANWHYAQQQLSSTPQSHTVDLHPDR